MKCLVVKSVGQEKKWMHRKWKLQSKLVVTWMKKSYRSAARIYDVSLTTLQREVTKFKSQPGNSSYEYKINLASRKVFTEDEERKLAIYIKKRANMCYGLKQSACRELAYNYAVANKKTYHKHGMKERWLDGSGWNFFAPKIDYHPGNLNQHL